MWEVDIHVYIQYFSIPSRNTIHRLLQGNKRKVYILCYCSSIVTVLCCPMKKFLKGICKLFMNLLF